MDEQDYLLHMLDTTDVVIRPSQVTKAIQHMKQIIFFITGDVQIISGVGWMDEQKHLLLMLDKEK